MKRILIIEDHEDTMLFYKSALSEAFEEGDYFLCCCETGNKGLEEFYKAHDSNRGFDLIITDLEIDPEQTGISVIKSILSTSPDALIVVATGNSNPALNLITQQLGIKHLWTKPISGFAAKVGDLLGLTMKESHEKNGGYEKPRKRIKTETLTFIIVALIAISQIRSTWMSPKLYQSVSQILNQQQQIGDKLGGFETKELTAGFPVKVPGITSQGQFMKETGRTRYTFEFEKGKVPAVEPGDELQIQITKKPK